MYKSYYYLNRLTLELNTTLAGKRITSIFSQDKDRLIIQLDSPEELYIEISVNHSDPFINIGSRFSRAKKNTIEFFNDLINKTIKEVLIASDDRIVKIVTDFGELIFAIRGKYTNLFFNSQTLSSFKNESEEILNMFKQEFEAKFYHNRFNIPDSDLIDGKSIEEIRQQYRFIGREIENEVFARKSFNQSDSKLLLLILQDLITEDSAVYTDEKTCEIHIGFNSLRIYSMYEKQLFESTIKAFNYFLSKRYQFEEKNSKLKKVVSHLDKELKKNSSRLNNLLVVVEKGSQEIECNKIANLLLINLNKLHSGLAEIELEDVYSPGSCLKVKLDTKLSPQKNVDRYFEKSRDSKINFEKSSKLYSSTKKEFEKLRSYQKQIEKNPSLEDINQIMKALKIKDQEKQNDNEEVGLKFKHYVIEKKYHVFVGKDSVNNDLLTTRFAKQNDFWFHARSVSGSHVVLRIENNKEAVPKNILKKAASLAAFHSKAKTAGVVPVSYTFKKYVIKRKGQPAGQVSLLKEDVLLVKPEIPFDTEYLTE
jgi:predicted ribosome quality control (RQC) complex YloA/Tae2 family protein